RKCSEKGTRPSLRCVEPIDGTVVVFALPIAARWNLRRDLSVAAPGLREEKVVGHKSHNAPAHASDGCRLTPAGTSARTVTPTASGGAPVAAPSRRDPSHSTRLPRQDGGAFSRF